MGLNPKNWGGQGLTQGPFRGAKITRKSPNAHPGFPFGGANPKKLGVGGAIVSARSRVTTPPTVVRNKPPVSEILC
jgi:hypothetical protein